MGLALKIRVNYGGVLDFARIFSFATIVYLTFACLSKEFLFCIKNVFIDRRRNF